VVWWKDFLARGIVGGGGGEGVELFFEMGEALEHLGELLEDGDGAEPEAVIEAGGAGDHFAGGDVVGDGGLGGEDDAVADRAVAGDADLSGEDDVVADDRGAGDAGLGADEGVLADVAGVADLDEVIDLGAVADDGGADGGAVDAGVGLHLDTVAELDGAGLRDLFPSGFAAGETEAVAADDGAVFEPDIVAELAELADNGVGVGEEAVADGGTVIDDNVGKDDGVGTDADASAEDGIGADVGVGTDGGGWVNDGGGVDAGGVDGGLIEELEGLGEGVVGVLDAQGGGRNFLEVGFDDDGGGAGGAGECSVARVGDEGDLGGAGLFETGDTGDLEVGVATEFGTE